MKPSRKPLYQPWDEEDFSGDIHVQAMNPFQRWMYRTLCQKSFVCSTRPYLPCDDSDLWMLSGSPNQAFWDQHKDLVLAMFSKQSVRGVELLARKRVVDDWKNIQNIRKSNKENAMKMWNDRRKQKAKGLDTSDRSAIEVPAHSDRSASAMQGSKEVKEVKKEEIQIQNLGPQTPRPVHPPGRKLEKLTKGLQPQQLRYGQVSKLITGAMLILAKAKEMGSPIGAGELKERLKDWAATAGIDYDADSVSKALDVVDERAKALV